MAGELGKQIEQDFITALKAREALQTDTLRMLKSVIQNLEIDKKGEASDDDIRGLIVKEVKKRKDAAEQFEAGGRGDSAKKELKEAELLQAYLPPQMSEDEVRKIVKETISQVGAESPQDMGKVMGALMPKTKGRADGAVVSKLVKEILGA